MHIQFWWAFSVLTVGPDLPSRSSRSRCSLVQQRMNGLRLLSNCRSLMGFVSASPIAALAPQIDLAPGLFSAAAEIDSRSFVLADEALNRAWVMNRPVPLVEAIVRHASLLHGFDYAEPGRATAR